MPTRKQRRRQQKSRRHEWEYVYVDGEGQEVEVDQEQVKPAKVDRAQARNGKGAESKGAATTKGRRARVIEPPSWHRVGKRALMIGPVVVVAMLLLNRNLPLGQRILPAAVMLAFFLPFSYFTDSLAYKMYKKRVDRGDARPKNTKS